MGRVLQIIKDILFPDIIPLNDPVFQQFIILYHWRMDSKETIIRRLKITEKEYKKYRSFRGTGTNGLNAIFRTQLND